VSEPVSLAQQVAEVGREIGMRKHVYPRLVRKRQMTEAEAKDRIARLEAAYQTLKALRDGAAR
jgi:hypothetical protein